MPVRSVRTPHCGHRQPTHRSRRLLFEPLEDRRLLSLLGLLPELPITLYDVDGSVTYSVADGAFELTGQPTVLFETATSPFRQFSGTQEFRISICVDQDGTLLGGVPGHDLRLEGDLDFDGDGTLDFSGELLTGEILQFGFQNVSSTDKYDFRFAITGGALAESPMTAANFAGKDIAVATTSEYSSFVGSFAQDFSGGAKGSLGPIDALIQATASLGDFVWHDQYHPCTHPIDGIRDAGEPGVEGVKVALSGAGVDAVFGTEDDVSALTYTDAEGYYLFDELVPGNYRVTFEPPDGYGFTLHDQASDEARDSDADPVTGTTGVVTLASDEDNRDVDAGLVCVGMDIEKYVNLLVEHGGEGLTPGYWKQGHHLDDWHDYDPGDNFNDVFGLADTDEDGSLTLRDALGRGGGGHKALGRHAVAALLNAARSNIDYAFTKPEIIAMVQATHTTGNFEEIKDQLEAENELGADLKDRRCDSGDGWDASDPGDDADTPPGPSFESGSTVLFTYVVTNGGETPLADVTVVDDNGTPLDEYDDFSPDFVSGDDNHNDLLDVGETWVFTHTEAVLAGEHMNLATATAQPVNREGTPLIGRVADDDPAYWIGTFDASTIHGTVWEDANNDGVIDAGERTIEGVAVQLTGTDFLGNAVSEVAVTDADGVYIFTDLQPSSPAGYTITEIQPLGYDDGIDVLGTVDGTELGIIADNDTFSGIVLSAGQNGADYNFAELSTAATVDFVHQGQTATIGFWQNRNGQRLLKSLNGAGDSTALGDWLAREFPNMYGDLAGKTNAEVAAHYKDLFRNFKKSRRSHNSGAAKLDPQVMAVAFAVYVTDQGLAGGSYGAAYGFEVTDTGLGSTSFDVDAAVGAGTAHTLFGTDASVLEVMDILKRTDERSWDGVIFDSNGDGVLQHEEDVMRRLANRLYTAINEVGDIG